MQNSVAMDISTNINKKYCRIWNSSSDCFLLKNLNIYNNKYNKRTENKKCIYYKFANDALFWICNTMMDIIKCTAISITFVFSVDAHLHLPLLSHCQTNEDLNSFCSLMFQCFKFKSIFLKMYILLLFLIIYVLCFINKCTK